MADWTIKQNTTRPIFTDTLTYSDGTSPVLTNATVTFIARSLGAAAPIINAAAAITNNTAPATVSYTPVSTNTAVAGQFACSWHVVFSDASTMDFPTVGYLDLVIEESLTSTTLPVSIVSLAEVKRYLRFADSDRTHDDLLNMYLTASVPVIENIVGPCVPQVFEEWVDGGSLAIVPRHRPVITLMAASLYIGPVEYVAVQVGTPDQGSIFSCELDMAGRIVRRGPGGSVMAFPTGLQAVHIVYQAGRNPIPDNIKMANLELIRDNYQPTQQGGRPGWGSGGVDQGDEIANIRPMLAVSTRVREFLVPSRRAPSVA